MIIRERLRFIIRIAIPAALLFFSACGKQLNEQSGFTDESVTEASLMSGGTAMSLHPVGSYRPAMLTSANDANRAIASVEKTRNVVTAQQNGFCIDPIVELYRVYLGRDYRTGRVSDDEINYWMNQLVAGVPFTVITAGFQNSAEAQSYGGWNYAATVAFHYRTDLHRSPEAGAITNWVSIWNSQGLPAVASGINSSQEHQNLILRSGYRFFGRPMAEQYIDILAQVPPCGAGQCDLATWLFGGQLTFGYPYDTGPSTGGFLPGQTTFADFQNSLRAIPGYAQQGGTNVENLIGMMRSIFQCHPEIPVNVPAAVQTYGQQDLTSQNGANGANTTLVSLIQQANPSQWGYPYHQ